MKYTDCVVKCLLPWYNQEGGKEFSMLRIDARGQHVDHRRVQRIVRKWYKEALGISLPECLLKNPLFVRLIIQPSEVVAGAIIKIPDTAKEEYQQELDEMCFALQNETEEEYQALLDSNAATIN